VVQKLPKEFTLTPKVHIATAQTIEDIYSISITFIGPLHYPHYLTMKEYRWKAAGENFQCEKTEKEMRVKRQEDISEQQNMISQLHINHNSIHKLGK